MSTSSLSAIEICQADLASPRHQQAVLDMVDTYARDPLANNAPLPAEIKGRLIDGLRQHPTTVIMLAFEGATPVGIAVCFLGFSTFAARPLLNIHDFCTAPSHRGRGVGRLLMQAVEDRARQLGCCKLTLEVQENNHRARAVYQAAGFGGYALQDQGGAALFLARAL